MFDRCLYFNTNHLARTVGKIWQEAFEEVGLAPAHAYLLRLVLEQPGIAQSKISAELHLEKSTITRFIDKMVDQGY
ncbi:MAG: MarR family transcriptional regulator, partial [Kangiellaceae bacterium]|nr:MarR family transcriptional regulator [Kangiellaceae bacterium]